MKAAPRLEAARSRSYITGGQQTDRQSFDLQTKMLLAAWNILTSTDANAGSSALMSRDSPLPPPSASPAWPVSTGALSRRFTRFLWELGDVPEVHGSSGDLQRSDDADPGNAESAALSRHPPRPSAGGHRAASLKELRSSQTIFPQNLTNWPLIHGEPEPCDPKGNTGRRGRGQRPK